MSADAGRPAPPSAASGPVEVEKRAAFESPARLAEREPTQRRMRRPLATAFGSVLVVLRVMAGVVWLIALAAQWDTLVEQEFDVRLEATSDAAASDAALTVVLLVGGTVLVIDLVFAVLIWFGSNWPRIMVMLFATINITVAAIDSFTGDAEVSIRTTLLTVALDILILLALSSRDSRAWARRPRRRPARSRRD